MALAHWKRVWYNIGMIQKKTLQRVFGAVLVAAAGAVMVWQLYTILILGMIHVASGLLLIAMVLVAASVSLRFFRFGGVTKLVIGGVAAGFVLYVATHLSEELGSSGIVNPVVAAWLPAALGAMLGALALLHQEDG